MNEAEHNEKISNFLYSSFSKEMINDVMSGDVELGPDFMGFVNIYDGLAKIIPLHFNIIDLGCYAAEHGISETTLRKRIKNGQIVLNKDEE